MLTITQTAAEALDTIVSSVPDAPETSGLRISPSASEDGQAGFRLDLATAPEPGDQVIDSPSVPVFVDSDVADELSDKVLDAQVQEGRVGFMLAQA